MKRAIRGSLLLLAIALALGCAGPRVTTDWDPSISWPLVRRYAWLPDPPGLSGDPQLHNALVDARVRRAVESELDAQGYERVSRQRADVFVTYYLGLETRVNLQWVTHTHAYRPGGWHERHRTEVRGREHEVGTLLIDILTRERNLIWRGSTSSRVRRNLDPTEREERIATAVAAILAEFPPTDDCPSCRR
jgi:hypothetical protein